MRGGKEATINQAALVEAVQQWLDTQYKEGMSPRVIKVERAPGQYQDDEFRLTFAQPDENKVAP